MTPEFSRPLLVERVPRGGSYEKISADAAECSALAQRLGVPMIHALHAEMRATPWRGGGLKLDGFVRADMDQVSVVSLDAFRAQVEYPLQRYFMPMGAQAAAEDTETDPIVAGHVDLGEIAAETLALELDPYPRKPGEVFGAAALEPVAKASPFANLSRYKPK